MIVEFIMIMIHDFPDLDLTDLPLVCNSQFLIEVCGYILNNKTGVSIVLAYTCR